MCGIFGQSVSDNEDIKKSLELLRHRGPDAVSFLTLGNVQFGICRLAIVNQSEMFQPYLAHDNSLMIVLNGEIYNFRKLIDKYSLRTSLKGMDDGAFLTDLFNSLGVKMFYELDGMFAIAIYDAEEQKIFLARDKAGIKPLYYRIDAINGLKFSSEMQPLKQDNSEQSNKTNEKILEYFLVGHISAPQTYYDDIQCLLPGDVIEYDIKTRTISFVLNLNESQNIDEYGDKQWSFEEAVENLELILFDSIESILNHGDCNDLFFSGGLDSSLIAALIKANNGSIRLHKLEFLNSGERKSQESTLARSLATKLGFELFEHELTVEEFFERLPEVYSVFGQPFAGVPSSFFLSERVSKFGKTVVTGDGADELFGSYRFATEMAKYIASTNVGKNSKETVANLFFEKKVYVNLASFFKVTKPNQESTVRAFCNTLSMRYFDWAYSSATLSEETDMLNLVLQYDSNIILGNQVLLFSDHLGMRSSLEIRPVFLTNKIQTFAKSITSNFKMNDEYKTKAILRALALKYLTRETINQVKEGFQSPLKHWLGSKEFMNRIEVAQWKRSLSSIPFFDLDKVEEQIKMFSNGDMREFFLIYKIWLLHEWLEANS